MKAKSIATVVLLAFVGVSVACLVIQETTSKPVVQSEPVPTETTKPVSRTPGDVEATSRRSEAGATSEADAPAAQTDQQTDHKLIAYYFHRTQRCRKCLTIEAYAEEALKDAFPNALKTGELEWHALNVEEPANEHFVRDYQLTFGALVLVDTQNGEQKEWRNLERVWQLVGNELNFKAYVEAEAMAFLAEED
ncbi:MAG: nitrophenyl compound nitroreductase subunit ArsF family protein [Planctomycetota bacterium]|jgi:hypothetical protein